jgi:hypothetical protein
MVNGEAPLDPAIEVQVAAQLRTNECIHWWLIVPTGDLVVALIDRDLQRACARLTKEVAHQRLGWGRSLVYAQEGGRWRQVAAGAWGVGVWAILEYFKAANRAHPGSHWERGRRFCLDWLQLIGREPVTLVTQADIDGLLARLDGEPEADAAWPEVRRRFTGWARGRGFAVPDMVCGEPSAAPDRPRD